MKEPVGPGVLDNQTFWCNKCDSAKVNSEDESTGHFFFQSGHIWKGMTYGGVSEDYVMVVYALCPACLD